jgi:hypothetical protein
MAVTSRPRYVPVSFLCVEILTTKGVSSFGKDRKYSVDAVDRTKGAVEGAAPTTMIKSVVDAARLLRSHPGATERRPYPRRNPAPSGAADRIL